MPATFSYDYPSGHAHEGTYSIFGEPIRIEVITEFGTRTARLEETTPEVLARMIARELAKEAALRGKRR